MFSLIRSILVLMNSPYCGLILAESRIVSQNSRRKPEVMAQASRAMFDANPLGRRNFFLDGLFGLIINN